MRALRDGFFDGRNFPVNVWIAVMILAGGITGLALGPRFAKVLFNPDMPALLGSITLALLLWAVTLAPLYWLDFPLQSGKRRCLTALVLAMAAFLAWGASGDALSRALYFYLPAVFLGFPCLYEPGDEFEERQDQGPGVLAALLERVFGNLRDAKLPNLWVILRRRILPLREERS